MNFILSKLRPLLTRFVPLVAGLGILFTGLGSFFGELSGFMTGGSFDLEALRAAGEVVVGAAASVFAFRPAQG